MKLIKLIILSLVLIEAFIFRGKHFMAFSIWFEEFLGQHITNSIMKNY